MQNIHMGKYKNKCKTIDKLRCPSKKIFNGLVMSLTITSIMLMIYYSNKDRDKEDIIEDDPEYEMYYEYMGDKIRQESNEINSVNLLKEKVDKINKDQIIYLSRRYGAFKSSTFVIVIQIHRHTEFIFLNALLDSLKNSLGITNCLIIFSHGSYDDEINELIDDVHFAKYMNIYYPYSTELYPHVFPGADTKFCTNDFNCQKSMLRDERLAQKKHFWWWQMNYVFDKVTIIANYSKMVVFLESNQYVIKDFLFVYKVMEAMILDDCPECEMISLGVTHAPEFKRFHKHNGHMAVSPWNSHMGSIGIAFNRSVWNGIKKYSSFFCNCNDYRWDFTLKKLGLERPKGQFMVLSSVSPRVFTYQCEGIVECSHERMVEEATNFVKNVHENL